MGERVILYSIPRCPHCKTVKEILTDNNVSYEEIVDIELMKQKGFYSAPMLEIGWLTMSYEEVLAWAKDKFK